MLQIFGSLLSVRSNLDRPYRARLEKQMAAATGIGIIGLLPLVPALVRNFEWRSFLDYRTDQASIAEVVGRHWLIVIPVSLGVIYLSHFLSQQSQPAGGNSEVHRDNNINSTFRRRLFL